MLPKSLCLLLIFLTFNADAQWISTGGPGPGSPILSFAVSGSDIFAGSWAGEYSGGVYLSTDEGGNWIPINTGLTDSVVFAFALKSEKIFIATGNGGVFSSSNNGTTWESKNNGLSNINVRTLAVSGTNLFCGTYGGVFLSTNDGISWTAVNNGLPIDPNVPFIVSSLTLVDTYLFAGTDGYGIFLSTDNGANWLEINNGLTNTRVQCLSTIGSNIFAGTFYGVFMSTNYGATWLDTQALTGIIINSLYSTSTRVFAGFSGGGIYMGEDNGVNWTPIGEGIPNTSVNAFIVSGSKIYAGTQSGLVYQRELSEIITSTGNNSNDVPDHYNLIQNFPNPFNPSTKIQFQIPRSSLITLKIYDVIGNEVRTLVNEYREAGYYETVFNGYDLTSGVYIYKLISGGSVLTKKMLLIK